MEVDPEELQEENTSFYNGYPLDFEYFNMAHGMLVEISEELREKFPHEEHFKLQQLNTLYLAARSSQMMRFVEALNTANSKAVQTYLVNTNFDQPDGQSLTPLTMAAMSGNVTFVKTLLSHYDVDLERECNVIFDGLVVYGATALWVAAGMGHLQIVKMLVQAGAAINHNTKAQSSPLRAACYEGRLDIVQFLIEHGADVNATNLFNNNTLMIAAYKGHHLVVKTLLQNGSRPNDQALCGATALHYAAESSNLDVVLVLLDHGATLKKNEIGITPALQAAERLNDDVVEAFIQRPDLMSLEEQITALELLGATYANDKTKYDINRAYSYLLRAMQLRYSDPRGVIRKKVQPPVPAYDSWFETENLPELNAIKLNHHSIHMESLAIRERILGRNNPDVPQAIVYRGAVMADHGRFDQCQVLWNYAIDLRMRNNVSVDRDLLRFAQLFAQILRADNHRLTLDHVLPVLTKCQQEIENNKFKIRQAKPNTCASLLQDQNNQNCITALYLIKIVTQLARRKKDQDINEEHIQQLFLVVRKFIQNDTRLNDGQTLLHIAVNGVMPVDEFYTNEMCRFPCYATALVLVHCGASVVAVDAARNTPLHILVSKVNSSQDRQGEMARILQLFVEAGAHLDAVNAAGQTAAAACKSGLATLANLLHGHQNAHTSLKCLAARTIATHRLNFKGLIPMQLEAFIQMHSVHKVLP
ncbi:protein fem-1 homolog B isoform X1 [Drosophila persimilis]|uniref:Protein fem-1 homolog B n=1 Tax=Drosophila pseudoobscura pseudoobscura TaxID=46245 RepID=A0A6I8V4D4_DROPS|nr:protein fem-1 homolog B isoform X1 [Drosophila pseudoobscura]XP_026841675.1 protein fem-1 homolog B isoform X1 [Drosophila persimilis]